MITFFHISYNLTGKWNFDIARKKINNYFNKIHKKRISQRSKVFVLRIIFTKMTANSLCISFILFVTN